MIEESPPKMERSDYRALTPMPIGICTFAIPSILIVFIIYLIRHSP